jgi:hypothetical protein
MNEQDRRALFFASTGYLASQEVDDYAAFCKGMDAAREVIAATFDSSPNAEMFRQDIAYEIRNPAKDSDK